jgi:hypothetical protein
MTIKMKKCFTHHKNMVSNMRAERGLRPLILYRINARMLKLTKILSSDKSRYSDSGVFSGKKQALSYKELIATETYSLT